MKEKWYKDIPIEERIKIADQILPFFMSKEDYKKLCELTREIKKKYE